MCAEIILVGQFYIKYKTTMIAIGHNLKYIQKGPQKSGSMGSLLVIEQESLYLYFRKFSITACQS